MARRNDIDWEAVSRDFRLGILTIRQVGEKHRVSRSQIQVRAKKEGWTRDLSSEVRAVAKAKVLRHSREEAEKEFKESVRESVKESVQAETVKVFDAVEVGAEVLATIEIKQRGRLLTNSEITKKLTRRLEKALDHEDDLVELAKMVQASDPEAAKGLFRLTDLPSLVDTHKRLVELNSKQQADERTAFGMNDQPPQDDERTKLLRKIVDAEEVAAANSGSQE